MRKKLIAANWKMHGGLEANRALVEAVCQGGSDLSSEVVLCVPFPYLAQVGALLQGSTITLGAQNSSEFESGAYTGEVSAGMVAEFGCSHVILGHSERRTLFGESDGQVAGKVLQALAAGLRPIVCTGECEAARLEGRTTQVVSRQLAAVLEAVPDDACAAMVVAYEPIWAIGTGLSASPEQAQAVHRQIRALLKDRFGAAAELVQILYGGSVKAANASALFAMPDIDGGLIGGASLLADDFLAICAAGDLVT